MRTRLMLCLVAIAALLLPLAPAQAIVNGQPDGSKHPYVGELLFYVPDEGGWFTCSGSLLDAQTVVTAGHCTYGVGKGGVSTITSPSAGDGGTDVWFNPSEKPDFTAFAAVKTYAGRAAALNVDPNWHRGTAHPHPLYDDAAFFEHDAGILKLDTGDGVTRSQYATLPVLNRLDILAKNSKQLYTPVGYGLEGSSPKTSFGGDTRRFAQVTLVSLNGAYGTGKGVSAKFSGNNGKPHTGGTCFGDSGGPFLVGDTNEIVAVNSYGISTNCKGGGGGYRLDQADDLNFIRSYLP